MLTDLLANLIIGGVASTAFILGVLIYRLTKSEIVDTLPKISDRISFIFGVVLALFLGAISQLFSLSILSFSIALVSSILVLARIKKEIMYGLIFSFLFFISYLASLLLV